MDNYKISLDVYEGPLDVLYEMISKKKIEIIDVSIIDITHQYIEFIGALDAESIDIATEFIEMASRLLNIKSRYLLYLENKEEEENPTIDLIAQLERYKMYKLAADELSERMLIEDNRAYRKRTEVYTESKTVINSIDPREILRLVGTIFSSDNREYVEKKSRELGEIVRKKNISLSVMMERIRNKFSSVKSMSFDELIDTDDKDSTIAAFLCVLELIKGKEIEVTQDGIMGRICIYSKQGEQVEGN